MLDRMPARKGRGGKHATNRDSPSARHVSRSDLTDDEKFLLSCNFQHTAMAKIYAIKKGIVASDSAYPTGMPPTEEQPASGFKTYLEGYLPENTTYITRRIRGLPGYDNDTMKHVIDRLSAPETRREADKYTMSGSTMPRPAAPGHLAYLESCLSDNSMMLTHKLSEMIRYAHAAMKQQEWHDAVTPDLFFAAVLMVNKDTELRTSKEHEGMQTLLSYANNQRTRPHTAQERFSALLQIKRDLDGTLMHEEFWRTALYGKMDR
jgi:hypothetical protein